MSDQNTPQTELRDPATPAARLATIAATNPELGADIARHPNVYDGLLDWLAQYGDAAARAAVAERRGSAGAATAEAGNAAAPQDNPIVPQGSPIVPQGNPAAPQGTPVIPQGTPAAPADGYAAAAPYVGSAPAAPKKKSRKGLTITLVAAGLVVIVGGGGAVWAVNSILGGAKSPEAAAEKVFEGALKLDPIALYTAMSPSEVKPLEEALKQLEDLPTSSDENAKSVQETLQSVIDAVEVTTDGLEYRTDELMDGVSRVSLVDGTLEIDADTDELGDALRDFMEVSMRASLEQSGYYSDEEIDELLDESLDAQIDFMLESIDRELPLEVDFSETWDDQLSDKQSYDIAEDDAFIGQGYPFSVITVDEGGWYTSPMLTAVDLAAGEEMIRSGYSYGDEIIEAEKFGSPEDAAHGFADGLVEFVSNGDYEAFAATLPFAERRAVSLYGPALADLGNSEDASISGFDVETEDTNGLTGLRISNLEFLRGDTVTGTYSHPCFEDQYSGEQCIDDVPALKLLGLDEALPIAIKEDGGWFVSPTATAGNALAIVSKNLAQLIEDDELDKLFEF